MLKNPNHPKKGTVIKVQPLRHLEDIEKVRALLKSNPRDRTIFNIGVNTNLRAIDLVSLKVGQVKYLKPGETLVLREQKTKKARAISINLTCYKSIRALLKSKEMQGATDNDFLFRSRKGQAQLLPNTLNGLVRKWTKKAELRGKFGSHTLRKTFGYIHRTVLSTDISILIKMFNHSTQGQTLDYLCIQAEEIKNAYMKEI